MITIYALICPVQHKIRYIGKSNQILSRYRGHLLGYGNYHRSNWINILKKQNLKPSFIILEYNPDNWQSRERFWIKYLRDKDNKLTNMTDGGEGSVGFVPIFTQKHRERISEAMKGKKLSNETKKKISNALKGRKRSKKHCKNLSLSRKGKKFSQEHKDKMRLANIGKKLSNETKKKISNAHLKYWANKKNNLKNI